MLIISCTSSPPAMFSKYLELLRELNKEPSMSPTLPGVVPWVIVQNAEPPLMGGKHNLLLDGFAFKDVRSCF